jgi:hypothetical protein
VQRVKDFATFLGRSPDTAKSEEVRGFRLHLASSGAGTPKINATVSALRFLFNVTRDRPDLAKHLSFMHEPLEDGRAHPERSLRGNVGDCPLGRWVQINLKRAHVSVPRGYSLAPAFV